MLECLKEAREFTKDVLYEKALQVLQSSDLQNDVYRSKAIAGRATYLRQLEMIEQAKLTGMDELIEIFK